MAEEETTIPLDGGSSPAADSSAQVGLDDSPAPEPPVPDTPAEDVSALRSRLDELHRLNDQYKRERAGWEQQSRRNLDERNALAERLARLEGQLSGLAQGRDPQPPPYQPGQMAAAMDKYMSGDTNALSATEQAMYQTLLQQVKGAQPQGLSADEIKKIILDELVSLGTKGNVQTVVGTNHPDLTNPQSPLSQAVWDQYDGYAHTQQVQVMYPPHAQYEIPMIGPDGSQRLVDARIVDRLAADIRLRQGVQEGRRQEHRASTMGGAMAGNGQTTTTPRQARVEAVELLTPAEVAYLQNPDVQKGWKELPRDLKAAAKFLYDGWDAEERQRRLEAYRSRARVTA